MNIFTLIQVFGKLLVFGISSATFLNIDFIWAILLFSEKNGGFMAEFILFLKRTLQTHHVCPTLKWRGNDGFHVVSTWNTCGVFVGKSQDFLTLLQVSGWDIFCPRSVLVPRQSKNFSAISSDTFDNLTSLDTFQKQPPEEFCKKRCSLKFLRTPV